MILKRLIPLILVIAAIGAAWLAVQTMDGRQAARTVDAQTGAATLVITPGATVIAFYIFLVALALAPLVWAACSLWLVRRRSGPARPAYRTAQRVYIILAGIALCIASGLAGFAYEALQTEIRLTSQSLSYRSGGEKARMRLRDIRTMVIRWHRRSQIVDLRGVRDVIRIDLTAFALQDQKLIINMLPVLARLRRAPQPEPDVWVWKRDAPLLIAPEPANVKPPGSPPMSAPR